VRRRAPRRRRGLALAAGAVLASCSSPEPVHESCPGTSTSALINGSADESYLAIGADQLRAIVRIQDATDPNGPLCSGVLVGENWAVTAAHCLQIQSAVALARTDAGTVAWRVSQTFAHPTLDLALLELEAPDTGAAGEAGTGGASAAPTGITPIEPASADDFGFVSEEAVEVAGYGITETGSSHDLKFLTERIVTVADDLVTVDGFGTSGACAGDSGGPLLARGRDGRVVVAGVLSTGSASCREDDNYVRLDAAAAWMDEIMGTLDGGNADCGAVSAEGRCLFGAALHCDGSTLISDVCEAGTRCGWDTASAGFRCVKPALDPCDGVDSLGGCRDGAAARCVAGTLELEPCACGQSCGLDGTTGGPRCLDTSNDTTQKPSSAWRTEEALQ
jgi:hypothetical protein